MAYYTYACECGVEKVLSRSISDRDNVEPLCDKDSCKVKRLIDKPGWVGVK